MNELLRNSYGSTDKFVVYDGKESGKRKMAGGCLSASCCWYAKKGSTYSFYFPMTSKRFRSLGSCYWCIFSEEEIVEYLEDINRILETPITWDFEYLAEGKVLRLSINIPKKYNERQCLYILTRVRQLAEMPFALYLKDAIRLWKTREVAGWDSIEHCFWRVLMCLPEVILEDNKRFCGYSSHPLFASNRCSIPGGKSSHSGDYNNTYTEWESLEVYKARLKEIQPGDYYYNKLFKKGNYKTKKLKWSDHFFDLDFWLSGFELRLPVYLGKDEVPDLGDVPRYPNSELFSLGDGPEDYVKIINDREGVL